MGQFRRCLNELELKESTLIGCKYTWSNERSSPTLVKLDRWFASVDWDEIFPDASLTAMSSSLSDHCPILMTTADELAVGKRFRFERFWLSLGGFQEEVQTLWNCNAAGGVPADPLRRLGFKLLRVSRGLSRWSQRRVGSVRDSILLANEVILRLDVAQDSRQLSPAEHWLRRGLKLKVLGLASLQRTITRQRARVAGLTEGDASSQFFRILATSRKKHSSSFALRHGDRRAADLDVKVSLATDYYMDLLGKP
ncbi:uncharacterized protein [Lolium perenne]|uniref:uncharacterized protein n=1 Tax=Lolium perenne TaxID=4522 RepID=UPI003A99E9C8